MALQVLSHEDHHPTAQTTTTVPQVHHPGREAMEETEVETAVTGSQTDLRDHHQMDQMEEAGSKVVVRRSEGLLDAIWEERSASDLA